jgi:hypothetical protein
MIHMVVMECLMIPLTTLVGLPLLIRTELLRRSWSWRFCVQTPQPCCRVNPVDLRLQAVGHATEMGKLMHTEFWTKHPMNFQETGCKNVTWMKLAQDFSSSRLQYQC